MLTIQRQLELLVRHIKDTSGRSFTVRHIASKTGITDQTLLNLLHGRVHNPRLHTLQQLSMFFDVSLDYFGFETEAQCLSYLARQGKLGTAPETIRAIDTLAMTLSSETNANVLTILHWRQLGMTDDSQNRRL